MTFIDPNSSKIEKNDAFQSQKTQIADALDQGRLNIAQEFEEKIAFMKATMSLNERTAYRKELNAAKTLAREALRETKNLRLAELRINREKAFGREPSTANLETVATAKTSQPIDPVEAIETPNTPTEEVEGEIDIATNDIQAAEMEENLTVEELVSLFEAKRFELCKMYREKRAELEQSDISILDQNGLLLQAMNEEEMDLIELKSDFEARKALLNPNDAIAIENTENLNIEEIEHSR